MTSSPPGPVAAPKRWTLALGRTGAAALLFVGVVLVLMHWSDERWMDRQLAALPAATSEEEQLLHIFDWVVTWADSFDADRIDAPLQRAVAVAEHNSPLHLSARSVLSAGGDHIGFCGSLTRSMLVALERTDLPARKAILYDRSGIGVHTVLEVQVDGEWRILDPTYDWYWRRDDGEIAGVADLASTDSLFATVKATVPRYPLDLYNYDDVRYLRWEKIPGATRLRGALVGWLGEARVQSWQTPSVYEHPRALLGWFLSLLGLTGLLVLRWWARRS